MEAKTCSSSSSIASSCRGEGRAALCARTPGPTTALAESQNIPQSSGRDQAISTSTPAGSSSSLVAGSDGQASSRGACPGDNASASVAPTRPLIAPLPPACTPEPSVVVRANGHAAAAPPPVGQKEGKPRQQRQQEQQQQQQQHRQRTQRERDEGVLDDANTSSTSGLSGTRVSKSNGGPAPTTPAASDRLEGVIASVEANDAEAESLALARQLLEEEAMASYTMAVGMFRAGAGAGDGGGGVGPMEGVAAEDMAAMQALLEEDENSPDAYAMAEDDSLDYDGMLELGSAIGDVRKERWRLRSKDVIKSLGRFRYTVPDNSEGSGEQEDTKCLICQCDFEVDEELRRLPCDHTFHTECVDGWLEDNEECPTCRNSVDSAATKPKQG